MHKTNHLTWTEPFDLFMIIDQNQAILKPPWSDQRNGPCKLMLSLLALEAFKYGPLESLQSKEYDEADSIAF